MTRSVVALTYASAPSSVLIGRIVGALSVTDVLQVPAAFVLLTAAVLLAWVGHVGMTWHVRHSGPLYAQVAHGLGAVPASRRRPSSASLALCRRPDDGLRIPAADDHNRISACLPTTRSVAVAPLLDRLINAGLPTSDRNHLWRLPQPRTGRRS